MFKTYFNNKHDFTDFLQYKLLSFLTYFKFLFFKLCWCIIFIFSIPNIVTLVIFSIVFHISIYAYKFLMNAFHFQFSRINGIKLFNTMYLILALKRVKKLVNKKLLQIIHYFQNTVSIEIKFKILCVFLGKHIPPNNLFQNII